jgi:hypothetical protein
MVEIATLLEFTSDEVRKPIIVDRPFLAIGDIHGHADLFEAYANAYSAFDVVPCGDLGDRGPDTGGVYRIAANRSNIWTVEGNHDEWPILLIRFAAGEDIEIADLKDVLSLWLCNNVGRTLATIDRQIERDPDIDDYLEERPYDVRRVAFKIGTALRNTINHGADLDVATWAKNKVIDAYVSGNIAVVHAQRPKHHQTLDDLVINYKTNRSMVNPRPYRPKHPIRWSRSKEYAAGSWTVHGHERSHHAGQPNGWGLCLDIGCGYPRVTTANKLMAALIENDRITIKIASY